MIYEIEDNELVVGDEENQIESNGGEDDVDDCLYRPLIDRSINRDDGLTSKHGSDIGIRRKSSSIGEVWQMAWKLPSDNGNVQDGMQQMYIHEEVPQCLHESGLDVSLGDKFIQAAALVNNSVLPKGQIEKSKFDVSKFDQSNKAHGDTK
jgi:hypothetical protein